MNIIQLIENFDTLQANDPCVFMLRHAEKPIVKNLHIDIANALTEYGVTSAKKLGNTLKNLYLKIGTVRSSPLMRCLDTAKNIFSAYPDTLIIPDKILGGDGAYVSDNQLAAQHFLDDPTRIDIFIRMQQGENFDGIRDTNTGTNILLTKITHDLEYITAPSFYITHDCILALFVGTVIYQVIDEKNWFQYLDGICIKKLNNRVNLYWKKECFDITEKTKRYTLR